MNTQGIIPWILPVHILAGLLALAFGYVALFAAKGAALHRRSGLLFVCAMVAMSLSGAFMDTLKTSGISVNVVAGLLTFYFVTTALLTVRPRVQQSQRIDAIFMLVGVTVAMFAFRAGVEMAERGRPEAAPMFIFGVIGVLAAVGDLRMIRARGIEGARRIARHLWRMCFAMWVAAASFFWGPPARVPDAIEIPALLAVVVLTPVAAMLYWLWRVRVRQSLRGLVGVSASRTTALERS